MQELCCLNTMYKSHAYKIDHPMLCSMAFVCIVTMTMLECYCKIQLQYYKAAMN